MRKGTNSLLGLGLALLLAGSLLAQAPAAPAGKSTLPTVASATSPPAPSATQPHDRNFVIGNSDFLAISVWKEPEISRSLPVRSDGRISLPLVGELQAAGRTPLQLETEIAEKLQDYITKPEVTVIVEQINSQKFNILGQVLKPGSYPLTTPMTILDAIAAAGGFRDFAKQKSIYILRRTTDSQESRIAINYKEVIKGGSRAQNIRLEPGDTIVVP